MLKICRWRHTSPSFCKLRRRETNAFISDDEDYLEEMDYEEDDDEEEVVDDEEEPAEPLLDEDEEDPEERAFESDTDDVVLSVPPQ